MTLAIHTPPLLTHTHTLTQHVNYIRTPLLLHTSPPPHPILSCSFVKSKKEGKSTNVDLVDTGIRCGDAD